MDVFLVPVGSDRHELYCEAEDDESAATEGRSSWWKRQVARFWELIREAEAERDRRAQGQPTKSRGLWRYIVGKIAEAVAEQRLLWLLQRKTAAQLHFPDDLDAGQALSIARESMKRDFEKHRRWLGIDSLVFLLFVPLTVIPGPNVPALYFSFRAVAHYFSMRGARQGLAGIVWTPVTCKPLTEVRRALDLERQERRRRIDTIARELDLERLAAFVDRIKGTEPASARASAGQAG
jgi:Mitochondrial K+-H+ exchange-related